MKLKTNRDFRDRRHSRLRSKVSGTSERPRMCVNISNKHMCIQLVDDISARTIASVSSLSKGAKPGVTKETARCLGEKIAEAAKSKGISQAVFDRGGRMYHGRVRTAAEAAREAGIKI